MKRQRVLRRAEAVVMGRQQSYGDPAASMTAVAARWSVTLGRVVTPEQVVLCLIELKLARLSHNPGHCDSAVDLAGYAALLHEITSCGGVPGVTAAIDQNLSISNATAGAARTSWW